MVKTRNNEDLLKKLEYPLLVAKRKLEHIEEKIDAIKRDILEPPILCCKQSFISHQDLRNHTKSLSCKNKAEPMAQCTMCRNKFYGLTKGEVDTLGIGNGRFDNSTYGKHYRECFYCECGYRYLSYTDKKKHKHFMPCRKHALSPTPKPRRHTPSPKARRSYSKSPLSNNLTMEISDRSECSSAVSSASSEELNNWRFEGNWYSYDKDNNVYDETGNNIGVRYKDELDDDWRIEYD